MNRLSLPLRILATTAVSFILSLVPGDTATSPEGPYFDALLKVREPIPVNREILLVERTGSTPPTSRRGPGPVELIWAVAELRAERSLIPPSWLREGGPDAESETAAEVASRVEEEFELIDENIAALFEAIRIGSIEPADADGFLGQLRRLVANSEARIQEQVGRESEGSGVSVEEMVQAFGTDRLGSTLSDFGLSPPNYDSALALPIPPGAEAGAPTFRSLPFSSLTRYVSLINRLAARLATLEEAGYFDEADPQDHPTIMRDHLRSLRRELYEEPSEARAARWRGAVDEYFETVAELIDSEEEARLLERLGSLEETEEPKAESAAQIREMKRDLSSSLATLREEYDSVMSLRSKLGEAVGGSFVIFENGSGDEGASLTAAFPGESTGRNARAVALNSALENSYLLVPTGWSRVLLLAAAGLLIAIFLAPLRAVPALALSPVAMGLVAALFPAFFLFSDIWVDPVSVAIVVGGATISSLLGALLSQWSVERTLTGRAVDRLPSRLLNRTVRRGGLPKRSRRRRWAAVVVVAPSAGSDESKLSAYHRDADELESFQRVISRWIRGLGGVVLGEQGPTILAVFEPPSKKRAAREPSPETEEARLAKEVCRATKELLSAPLPPGVAIRCGVDVGELLFYVSPIGGYRATGLAIAYARRLCGLTHKHRQRALFGHGVAAAFGKEAEGRFQEKGKLAARDGSGAYAFYTLTEIDPPSL